MNLENSPFYCSPSVSLIFTTFCPHNPPLPNRPKIISLPIGFAANVGTISGSTATRIDTTTTTAVVTATTVANLLDLIDPLLLIITSYLPNEDLMQLALSSKYTNQIIPRATTYESRAPGTIITVLHMLPSNDDEKNYGRLGRLDQ